MLEEQIKKCSSSQRAENVISTNNKEFDGVECYYRNRDS